MNYIRLGEGTPLLLLHGIGGSWRSWNPIFDGLAAEREVIALDLPGFGATPPLRGEVSIRTLADAVTEFLRTNNLIGVDAVGSSMGARLVLELARRGVLGSVVSLDPGGFWSGWQRHYFYHSAALSIKLIRALQPLLPVLTRSPVTRSMLFAQFSAHPWQLSPKVALDEVRTFAASPSFDELLYRLAYGEQQQGLSRGAMRAPIVIGWGRHDHVCPPDQAKRAMTLFPGAKLYWFKNSGHFPQWDVPGETTRLILTNTGGEATGGRTPHARKAAAKPVLRQAEAELTANRRTVAHTTAFPPTQI